MFEYTIISVIVLFVVVVLNELYNPLFKNRILIAKAIIFAVVAQLIMDNLTTWRGFWVFDESQVLGLFVPFIPIENLFFGISLMLLSILFYEKL